MLRKFTDRHDVIWRVWDVIPTVDGRERPKSGKRAPRPPSGWLCFDCGRERRRLSPVPPEWDTLDEAALEALCAKAKTVLQTRDSKSG